LERWRKNWNLGAQEGGRKANQRCRTMSIGSTDLYVRISEGRYTIKGGKFREKMQLGIAGKGERGET